jgi:catechol 2,3-dioxygenase-like lactoylglutathione lyase family enzyme
MRILGLTFAGTSTANRTAMTQFLSNTLGMRRVVVAGVEADLFELDDGAHFAVASPDTMGDSSRSIGFLVDDLAAVRSAVESDGYWVGDITSNEIEWYCHFRAPDGNLYELCQRKLST